jgi:ubiquinone/menaquinone biosynthesis C-methylase UbiE
MTVRSDGVYWRRNALASEAERLRLLERIADPRTERLLSEAGVAPGWDCAELGAGAGSVARSLTQRVGPEGSVLALDRDTTLLEHLRSIPQMTVREADLATSTLPRESFDLVHTRNLLMHLPDRDRILQELFEAVRPGGVLLVEEADGFPVSAATDETFRRTFETLTRRWTWARSLPRLISAKGPEHMTVLVETDMLQGGSDLAAFWHHTLRTARTLLQESEPALDDRDVDRTLELLDDRSFWTPFMAVVCVTATKRTA